MYSVSNDKIDLSDLIVKQDIFSLATNASICIPHVKDLSIFIPKNNMSKVLGISLFEYSTWISKFYYFYFKTVKQVF
jgi:hypothetical protein